MNDFLFSPTKQFLFPSGKILAGGKIYVFIKHTDNLATLYNDEDVEIANPVILDSNGRATVKADDTYDYKLDVYSPYDELLFTATSYLTDNFERDFAIISTDGSVDVNVSIDGYTTNWDLSVSGSINEATSGKFDTSAFEDFYNNTYGPTVSNINQRIDYVSGAVDELSSIIPSGTGTFSGVNTDLTLTGNGKDINLGINGTWFNEAVNSAYTGTTFTGVDIDSTLTGNGSTSSLGVNMNMLTGMLDTAKNDAVASAQSGLIRDISFEMQNVGIFGDSMSGYNADGTVWIRNHWTVERAEASGDELNNYLDTEYNTNYISMSPSAKEVFDAVRTNSGSWSQGTTYSSVSGTVQVSGNDLEIWNTGLRSDIKWDTDVWIHEDGTVTAGNGGWGASPNRTYRLTHVMSAGQYTNPAHPGFSAELRQEDENYNILSSTMIYGIFNPYEFTTVPGCDHCSLYYSGTTEELSRGVSVLTSNNNYYTFTDEFAWKTDVPTKTDFSNLYENIAVNSGDWGGGTSIDFHYIEV